MKRTNYVKLLCKVKLLPHEVRTATMYLHFSWPVGFVQNALWGFL